MLFYRNKMNWLQFCLFAVLSIACLLPAGADENGLSGNWARNDGATRMVIAPCGGAFCATNDWVKDPGGKEKVGDRLVLKLKPVSSSVFQGQAYDVRRQMTYKITLTLQGKAMRTSGCVLLGIICKNADWTRID